MVLLKRCPASDLSPLVLPPLSTQPPQPQALILPLIYEQINEIRGCNPQDIYHPLILAICPNKRT